MIGGLTFLENDMFEGDKDDMNGVDINLDKAPFMAELSISSLNNHRNLLHDDSIILKGPSLTTEQTHLKKIDPTVENQ